MDNNSTFVPGMDNSGTFGFNPYAQPEMGGGTVISGMQPSRKNPSASEGAASASCSTCTPVVGFLYSISNGGAREYWPIHVGTNIIGRGQEADIVLNEATVSERHAEIRVRELRNSKGLTATIQDLGSKTGILLNDEDPGYDLQVCKNGDILTIGENYRILVIFVDTYANGLCVAPDFIPVEIQKEEAIPTTHNIQGANPYDRNQRPTPSGTVDLNGNAPFTSTGGTLIME